MYFSPPRALSREASLWCFCSPVRCFQHFRTEKTSETDIRVSGPVECFEVDLSNCSSRLKDLVLVVPKCY